MPEAVLGQNALTPPYPPPRSSSSASPCTTLKIAKLLMLMIFLLPKEVLVELVRCASISRRALHPWRMRNLTILTQNKLSTLSLWPDSRYKDLSRSHPIQDPIWNLRSEIRGSSYAVFQHSVYNASWLMSVQWAKSVFKCILIIARYQGNYCTFVE